MVYHGTNVAERRRNITKMLVKGFTPGEIAKGIGASRETVYNDVRYIRSGQNEDLAEYGRKQMLAQVMLNARERVKELWSVVEKSESPYVKLLALRELRIHDQQTLNHIFLFTQIGEDKNIEGNNEEKIDAENVSQSCQRVQPAPACDDLVTNRQGGNDKEEEEVRDLSKSVNSCRKSLGTKELNLQTENPERKDKMYNSPFVMFSKQNITSARDDLSTSRHGVKTRRKSLPYKENRLQMENAPFMICRNRTNMDNLSGMAVVEPEELSYNGDFANHISRRRNVIQESESVWSEHLQEDIKLALEQMPEYKSILEMYGEMLEAQHSAKANLAPVEVDMDENRVAVSAASGLVLLREIETSFDIEAAKELFLKLKEIAASKGDEYSAQSKKINEAIKNGKIELGAVLEDAFSGGSMEDIKKKALELDIEPQFFALLASAAVRPALELYSEKLMPLLNENDWEKPFCPVCGRLPFISRLETKEGKRVLCCPACSATWRFPRLKCVNCGNSEHEKLRMLYADETSREQYADVCDNCKRYLKCVDIRKNMRAPVMQITDAATLHIDMLAQREGFVAL